MTLRGRLTVAAALVLAGLQLVWLLADEPDGAPGPESEPAPARAAAPTLPPQLLAPPVAREDLERVSDGAEDQGMRVRYTLDPRLTRRVWRLLDRGRVALGHVLVMEPETGALLAYVSTDPQSFPAQRTYPAASLVKVVTAAAAMDSDPVTAEQPCRYVGNPYRLTRRRLDPPGRGNTASLERALATSNNQCFGQWAVHRVGGRRLMDAIDRFGLLRPAAQGHASGLAEDPGDDRLALGRLGSGLSGLRITPLHAVQLAGTLAHGRRVSPHWIAAVEDTEGRSMAWPSLGAADAPQVLTPGLATSLRRMLVQTTRRGTARKAFRTRRGRPLLPGIAVAGKTGSLNGQDPDGRYEWFIGVAPADAPRVAVATVAVQGSLYWMSASQLAAEVLKELFCPKGVCRSEAMARYARSGAPARSPSAGGLAASGGH